MLLNKVVKEKDELRDSNSQHKCHTNDPRVSVGGRKERLLSHSSRVGAAENQTWDLILPLAEVQHERNSQPRWVSATKVKARTRGNGILKFGTETCGEALMKLVTLSSSILGESPCEQQWSLRSYRKCPSHE